MNNASTASSTLFFGHNGEWWDVSLIISVIAAALIAAAVGVATAGSIFAHKRESEAAQLELEKFKTDTAGRIAEATKAGIAAGEAAGAALAKAATLQGESDRAKLETELLKQTVSWREIDKSQGEVIRKTLDNSPAAVNLRFPDGDPEALYFAIQFSRTFQSAHWIVAPGSSKMNAIVFSLLLYGPESPAKKQINDALVTAGIPFKNGELPKTGSMTEFNVSTIDGAPTLLIGSRVPVSLQ